MNADHVNHKCFCKYESYFKQNLFLLVPGIDGYFRVGFCSGPEKNERNTKIRLICLHSFHWELKPEVASLFAAGRRVQQGQLSTTSGEELRLVHHARHQSRRLPVLMDHRTCLAYSYLCSDDGKWII